MYRHTQAGWMVLASIAVFVGILWLAPGVPPAMFVIAFLMLILFSTLTVTVDRDFVRFSFGIGLIRRSIPLRDVLSCQTVRNKWWWGWGIHGTPGKAWLFNVSGLDSVMLTMKSGGPKILIGTDEPVQLSQAIQRELDKNRG